MARGDDHRLPGGQRPDDHHDDRRLQRRAQPDPAARPRWRDQRRGPAEPRVAGSHGRHRAARGPRRVRLRRRLHGGRAGHRAAGGHSVRTALDHRGDRADRELRAARTGRSRRDAGDPRRVRRRVAGRQGTRRGHGALRRFDRGRPAEGLHLLARDLRRHSDGGRHLHAGGRPLRGGHGVVQGDVRRGPYRGRHRPQLRAEPVQPGPHRLLRRRPHRRVHRGRELPRLRDPFEDGADVPSRPRRR